MKEYKVTVEFDLALTVKVKAKITPEVPMTRHYPGDPPMIEEVVLEIEGAEGPVEIAGKFYDENQEQIDEMIWDKVNSEMDKMYEKWAANAQDEADYLRDIREDR